MASQWPAIIGTLGGTTLGVLSTWAFEQTRWRRQQSIRWDEHRQRLYGEFVGAMGTGLNRTVELAQAVSKISFLPDEGLPKHAQERFEELNRALGSLLDVVGAIRITSSKNASDAAQQWYEALAFLMRL